MSSDIINPVQFLPKKIQAQLPKILDVSHIDDFVRLDEDGEEEEDDDLFLAHLNGFDDPDNPFDSNDAFDQLSSITEKIIEDGKKLQKAGEKKNKSVATA